jgi:hypothetical protein
MESSVEQAGRRSDAAGEVWLRVLRAYYWATPLFFAADAIWGISVRAAFLPGPGQRLAYYAFCLACAYACQTSPKLAPFVGMAESAVSVFVLVLGVMLPIFSLTDAVAGGAPEPQLMTPGGMMNVLLSGTMLIIAFQRSRIRAVGELAHGHPATRLL